MAKIHVTTFVKAPTKRVYDLSRSVNLFKLSSSKTFEKFIEGLSSGQANENDRIVYQAKHFFKSRNLTIKIIRLNIPHQITIQLSMKGFKSFHYNLYFKTIKNGSFLIDIIEYETSYGVIGKLLDKIFIKNHLNKLLLHRNEIIKQYAETSKWMEILTQIK
jgi:hypothetical protein